MRKTVTKKKTETLIICDDCGQTTIPYELRVKACPLCGKDVCSRCAIVTDHWFLEDGSFAGDYPDHYCKSCWLKGESIRKAIQECRDREIQLWEEWRTLTEAK